MHVALEALRRADEPAGKDGRENERHANAERVGAKQHGAARGGILGAGDEQDGGKDRPDARGPAEGEGETDDISADEAGGLAVDLDPRLERADLYVAPLDTEPAEGEAS